MPLPVIADVWRVTLNWNCAGLNAHSVMHFFDNVGNVGDVFDAIDTNVTAAMWSAQCTNTIVESVDILALDGASSTVNFPTGSPARWKGVSGTSDIIPSSSNLVKFKTGFRGRSRRGRIYTPMPGEFCCSDGTLASTQVNAVQAAWDAFLAVMQAGDTNLVVASYVLGDFKKVMTAEAEAPLGTMRRRQAQLR